MKVKNYGKDVIVKEVQCKQCGSELRYTQYDLHSEYSDWYRTGAESSSRNVIQSVVCSVCLNKIIVSTYEDEF